MEIWTLLTGLSAVAVPVFADLAADAKAHSEAFARAMNARDVKAIIALYADDAHVIWPGQSDAAKGKAAIEKLVANALKGLPKDSEVTLKSQDAIPLGRGYIVAVGHWEHSFTGDDGKKQILHVRTTEVIKKQARKTPYVVDHASFGMPSDE